MAWHLPCLQGTSLLKPINGSNKKMAMERCFIFFNEGKNVVFTFCEKNGPCVFITFLHIAVMRERCLMCRLPMPSRKGKFVCSTTCRVRKKETFDMLEKRLRYLESIQGTLPSQSAQKHLREEYLNNGGRHSIWLNFIMKELQKKRERLKKRSLNTM